jgi:hypothetical protein
MICVGSLVRFSWWSSYKAPSASTNSSGRVSWHEIQPGDTGVVLSFQDENTSAVVLFSKIDALLKVNLSMLVLV